MCPTPNEDNEVAKDPARDVANFLADDATWDKRMERAVRTQADGLNALTSEVKGLKALIQGIPQLIADSAAENRKYYRVLQERMDEELGNEWDDVTGSRDARSLRDAGRNWRKKAREREQELAEEASLRAEEEARRKRWTAIGAALAPALLVAGGALLKLLEILAK